MRWETAAACSTRFVGPAGGWPGRVSGWGGVPVQRLVERDELRLEGGDRGLGAVLHVELGEDLGDVLLDGLLGDAEGSGDLPVGVPAGEVGEHFGFAGGQEGEGGPGTGPAAAGCRGTRRARPGPARSPSPRAAARTAAVISSTLAVLVRYDRAPRCRAWMTWSSSGEEVRTTTAMVGWSRWRAVSTSSPSGGGMIRSRRTTSGSSARTSARAWAPSRLSPTTSIPSSCVSRNRRPCRTTAWSSTMRTRIIDPPRPGR